MVVPLHDILYKLPEFLGFGYSWVFEVMQDFYHQS